MIKLRKVVTLTPTEKEVIDLICDNCSKAVDITTSIPFERPDTAIGWVNINEEFEAYTLRIDLCPECIAASDHILRAAGIDRKKRIK